MKILITGRTGYIGCRLKAWLSEKQPEWQVETVSVRDGLPSLEAVDAVVHAAALVHANAKKQHRPEAYDQVNRVLTLDLAKKAKEAQVGHFIFLSTMSVYGLTGVIEDIGGKPAVIEAATPCRPVTDYGRSKLSAESGLRELSLHRLSILRPPMVYGSGCPGNYARLEYLAKTSPVFPQVENRRSILHIDNLCELIRLMIRHRQEGFFYPQNEQYMNTSQWVQELALKHNHKIVLSKSLGRLVCNLPMETVRKLFGSLVYAQELSSFPYPYHVVMK